MTLLDVTPTHADPTRTSPETAALTVERLSPSFGACISGLDLDHATDGEIRAVRTALAEHKVLFFSAQELDPDSQISLGRRLGEVTESHPVVPGVDDEHPEIYALDSAEGGFADVWHTDVTFVRRPPLGSVLRAVVLPPTGGDTLWADLQLAYESLSAPVQRLADQLTAVHDGTREFGYYLAQRQVAETQWEGETYRALVPVEHPVVRMHPETGRKGLFVNPGFTSHLVGVSDAESRYLLDLFYAHITKPEHIVRHRWSVGDVAMWDNRSTVHYATRNYGDQRRVMHRITLRGDEPYGPAQD